MVDDVKIPESNLIIVSESNWVEPSLKVGYSLVKITDTIVVLMIYVMSKNVSDTVTVTVSSLTTDPWFRG